MLMKRLTISARQGCNPVHRNFLALFLLLLFALFKPDLTAGELPAAHLDLVQVEQQIYSTSRQLDGAAQAVRSAKRYVEEKNLELAQAHELQREQPSELHAHRLHHAQKRLALARLGLDTRVARFERIEQQLESLALSKLHLMAEQAEAITQKAAEQSSASKPIAAAPPKATTPDAPASSPSAVAAPESPNTAEKLTNPLAATPATPQTDSSQAGQAVPVQVQSAKIFGAGIPGEVALEPAGASQFVGRFYAPAKNLSLFVGFRTDQYHRQEIPVEFAAHEYGQPFVFVLDLSDPDRPLTRVFEESLMAEEELSSIYRGL